MGILSKLISLFSGSRSEPRASAPISQAPSRIGESHSHRVNEWVENQKKVTPKKKRTKPASRTPIDSVAFSYQDRDGNYTDRTVDVFSSDDEYFEGFCHSRLGTRTFKVRRVSGLVISVETGEAMKPQAWLRKIYNVPSNSHVISGNERLAKFNANKKPNSSHADIDARSNGERRQILFSGFDKDHRADLEETAEALGIATSTVKYRLREAIEFLKARATDPNLKAR